jgi:ABC-type antimicrobial peptide transport system permease subunit
VGKRLKMGSRDSDGPWYTVVGVAAQTRYREVASPRPTLYLPAAQFQMTATMLVLRTTASIDLVASAARERVGTVDPRVRVMRVVPFVEMLERPLARPRFNAFVLSLFSAVALLLSAVGLYAVMAAFVRQRDREIAVRLALGATTRTVRRMVITEAVRLAGVGAMFGLAGAIVSTRLLGGMLYEIDPLDPMAIAGSALLLIGVSALAAYVPAWRATRIDAATMLRSQ